MAKDEEKAPVIIIKKIKKGGGGHHGGAWKVAYADFVTAMMAFFLLLWLLNVTTDEMKSQLSAFFTDPTHPIVSNSVAGAGGVMGGRTMTAEGARAHDNVPLTPLATPAQARPKQSAGAGAGKSNLQKVKNEALKKEFERRQKEKFASKQAELQKAINASPRLKELSDHVIVEITPEGLKIQIVDQEGEAMFPSGSARMFNKTEEIISLIAEIISTMPNNLSIRGHTDATPYTSRKNYSNWELSADRANATRRVLIESEYPADKIENVMGKAAKDPFVEDNPADAKNRRITIILLNEEFVPSPEDEPLEDGQLRDESVRDGAYNEDGSLFSPDDLPDPGYRPSQGDVAFP
jgi:chemotaxis protein MotB